jgi:ESCRT-II complex subunit VPS36
MKSGEAGIAHGVLVGPHLYYEDLFTHFYSFIALIPPSTFLLVLPHLPAHTVPPIRTRTFASGLTVLHTPPYTHAAFAARLASSLALGGPKTTVQIANESDGDICRDDGSAAINGGGSGAGVELRWWMNVFKGYIWDGQE